MCVPPHTCTHTHANTCIHVCTGKCTPSYMCKCTFTHNTLCTCIHTTCMHTDTGASTHVHMHADVCTPACLCTQTCAHRCTHPHLSPGASYWAMCPSWGVQAPARTALCPGTPWVEAESHVPAGFPLGEPGKAFPREFVCFIENYSCTAQLT
jgi:hypothetical protein